MKTKEEFLAQVYDRYGQELARQTQRKKRLRTTVTAVAACAVLLLGVAQTDRFQTMLQHVLPGSGSEMADGAAPIGEADGNRSGDMAMPPGDTAPGENAEDIDSYFCLPRVVIHYSTDVQTEDDAAAHDGALRVIPGVEGLEAVEQILARLRAEDRVVEAETAQEDWQKTYTYQVEIEVQPRQVTFYYITGEVDWHEALESGENR